MKCTPFRLILPIFCLVLELGGARGFAAAPEAKKSAGPPLTLAQVLREVRAANPSLEAARLRAAAARERIPQARAWDDPALIYEGSVAGESDQSVKLQQTFPLSGRNRSRGRLARAEAGAAGQEARRAELDAVRDARRAYFEYAAAQGLLEINSRTGEALGQIAETARSRFEAARQSEAEVLTAEGEKARNSEARVDLERQRSDAQSALNRLMHRPPDAPLPVAGPLPVVPMEKTMRMDLPAMQAHALEHSPEVQAARSRVAAARARLQIARRQWIPDPSAALKGRRFVEQGERMSEAMVEISVSLPWANERKYTAGTREAEAALAAAEADLRSERDTTLAHVRDAARKAEAFAHHAELFHEKILPLSREALNVARIGYEAGRASLQETLAAQVRLREDEAMALRHALDLQTALAELDAITGAPNPTQP